MTLKLKQFKRKTEEFRKSNFLQRKKDVIRTKKRINIV